MSADVKKLLQEAIGPNFYWSRIPGQFVNKKTGVVYGGALTFNGTVREWYETLVETIVDVSHSIPGGANVCVVSDDIDTILSCSVLYKPFLHTPFPYPPGFVKVGTLDNRFAVYRDPECPHDKVFVGREVDGSVVADPKSCGSVSVLDMVPREESK